MRKLMWFTAGFAAACCLCTFSQKRFFLYVCAALLLCGVAFITAGCFIRKLRIPAVVGFGFAAGLVWFCVFVILTLAPARQADGKTMQCEVTARNYSFQTTHGTAFDGEMNLSSRRFRVRVYLNTEEEIQPGQTITGTFQCRFTTDGGSREPLSVRSKGIFLVLSQKGKCQIGEETTKSLLNVPALWRHRLSGIITQSFPADTSGFAKALLLGDREGLDYRTSTSFKVSGISHVIAVSGLHVSILFGLIYVLTGKQRILTALIGIPSVMLFAAVAGFTPSVTRAAIMQSLFMLSILLGREYDPLSSLSFAVFVMLAVNPLVITSVSFQLSAACMLGIFLFSDGVYQWLMDIHRLGRWKGMFTRGIAASVSVTVGSMVFTTALTAVHFGCVSLVGLLTNLVTLWVITFLFYGVMLVCLIGFIEPLFAALVGWVFAWPIRYVLEMAGLLSKFPLAAVYTRSIYIVLWLIFAYCLLAVFLARKQHFLRFLAITAAGLVLSVAISWAEPYFWDCQVSVLDIGQGQSVLLQSRGHTYLVDCGGDYDEKAADAAAETLLSQGIRRLDGIVVSHLDRDHVGGVPYLLTRIPAEKVYFPAVEGVEKMTAPLSSLADVELVSENLEFHGNQFQMDVFAPIFRKSDNESSMCVLFRTEKCDILITGDMGMETEKILLDRYDLPDVDVLVVGHHGSKTSTSRQLLETVKPEYAFISAGKNNRFGHPHPVVLDKLKAAGCAVYCTADYGTITFRR